ncbi:MAG: hypothetical protein ABW252_09445 [Polyangiales bacterium]
MKAVCIHVALCGLVTAVVSGCDQPKPNCLTAQASFVLKLAEEQNSRQESAPGACVGFGPASFNADPHVGIAPYYAKDKKGQPDYRKGSIAIRTAELATLVANAEEHDVTPIQQVLHSIGQFVTEEPDGDDFCRAPAFAQPTRVVIPAVSVPDDPATANADESFEQAAVDATLTWSDVDVYVTPASFGTQVRAKLSDRRVTPDGRVCTINYTARGLAPAVSCQVTDDDGNPVQKADGTFEVDPTLCNPEADPSKDRFTGSGISPTTNYECDATIGYCVLAGAAFPALK